MIQRDEIYLASFPFGDTAGMKLRPVLTLTGLIGPIPEVLVAYILSVVPQSLLPSDILLDPAMAEHGSTNLKAKSVIRLHKLATIHRRVIVRRLGRLPTATSSDAQQRLRNLFGL
ncbi:MAG: type II toxin-antitoxin system PemK/MazF family toxin [Pirellulales bacterium]